MERINMQTVDVQSRKNISETVFVPRSEAEYTRLAAMLDNLIDEVGEDETHPLASLMDVFIGTDRKLRKCQRVAMWLYAGRAKDYQKIAMFWEAGFLDESKLFNILRRHALTAKWNKEKWRFSGDEE
jgi:HTH-type transcriptional regulator / antitoxin HigA